MNKLMHSYIEQTCRCDRSKETILEMWINGLIGTNTLITTYYIFTLTFLSVYKQRLHL